MRPLGYWGIGLSLVSGCLFLAIVAELYYFFWWKKRKVVRDTEKENRATSPVKELLQLFNWKKPFYPDTTSLSPREICDSATRADNEQLSKPFEGEDTVEAELMILAGPPPSSLFTITEETVEDLEAADGTHRTEKSRNCSRGVSLKDLLLLAESPVLTPLPSPPHLSPPLRVNPLFEPSEKDGLTNWMWSSPPPKLKFLKDAEEKLYKKSLREEALESQRNTRCTENKNNVEEKREIPSLESTAITEIEDIRITPVLTPSTTNNEIPSG